MTLRTIRSVALFAVLVLSGCMPSAHVGAMGASGRSISLCEVVANLDAYNGADVEVRARYVSDGRHEEVLEDLTCSQGRRIIDIEGAETQNPSQGFTLKGKEFVPSAALHIYATRWQRLMWWALSA